MTAACRWLKPLAAAREMRVGVYTDVVDVGVMSVGDVVAAVTSTDATDTSGTVA